MHTYTSNTVNNRADTTSHAHVMLPNKHSTTNKPSNQTHIYKSNPAINRKGTPTYSHGKLAKSSSTIDKPDDQRHTTNSYTTISKTYTTSHTHGRLTNAYDHVKITDIISSSLLQLTSMEQNKAEKLGRCFRCSPIQEL